MCPRGISVPAYRWDRHCGEEWIIRDRRLMGILPIFLLAVGTGCGSGSSRTSAVSFAKDIQPIFNSRCTNCHNAVSARGALDLTSPGSYSQLINVATSPNCSAAVSGVVRVKPNDTMGSMLWRKTKPDPSRCLSPMPNGTAGLGVIAPDEFAKVEKWIQQGAPNN